MNSNVTSFQGYQIEKAFRKSVVPFFSRINPRFHHYREDSESIVVLNHDEYSFVFLKYIAKNEVTLLPTLLECFEPLRPNTRISNGEWLVEGIYDVKTDKAVRILEAMDTYDQSDVFQFLKNVLKK